MIDWIFYFNNTLQDIYSLCRTSCLINTIDYTLRECGNHLFCDEQKGSKHNLPILWSMKRHFNLTICIAMSSWTDINWQIRMRHLICLCRLPFDWQWCWRDSDFECFKMSIDIFSIGYIIEYILSLISAFITNSISVFVSFYISFSKANCCIIFRYFI